MGREEKMNILIKGINYHIEIEGKGPPIICLHGFSESQKTWQGINIAGYTLIKIDLVGHGTSDKPKDKSYYSVEAIANSLNIIIQHLGIKKCGLMGYSMGGRIALYFALKYTPLISFLILESSSYGECNNRKKELRRANDDKLAEQIRENGINWFENYWSSLRIFETQLHLPQTVQEKIRLMRISNSEEGLANILTECGQGVFPCQYDNLINLLIPTLYITGQLDEKYREIGKKIVDKSNFVKLTVIAQCGHNVHIEKPVEFINAVELFIKERNDEAYKVGNNQ